jgi:hypothetical protein
MAWFDLCMPWFDDERSSDSSAAQHLRESR